MIKPAVSALALALALAACGNPAETTAPSAATELTADQKAEVSKELNEWFDVKFEEALQESPITMTFLGRKDLNDQIDCFTFACADEQLARQKAAVEEMKTKFSYDDLSDARQTILGPLRIPVQPGRRSCEVPLQWLRL
jgi:hypothetical protein